MTLARARSSRGGASARPSSTRSATICAARNASRSCSCCRRASRASTRSGEPKNNAITDALNEAKDNVKYLSTLDKYIEPLYSASPPEVIESLSGLLNNLRMMHAIARYYATPERMTIAVCKITEQMIVNCRAWVTNEGSLWEQDTAALLDRLQTCHTLFQHYRAQYESTRDKLRENPQRSSLSSRRTSSSPSPTSSSAASRSSSTCSRPSTSSPRSPTTIWRAWRG